MTIAQSPYLLQYADEHHPSMTTLVGGRDVRFDDSSLISNFGPVPSERRVDFLRIASAVHAVDRLVRRRSGPDGTLWGRHLWIRIGVSDLSFWTDPEVHEALMEAIRFVTGDFWDIYFVRNPHPAPPAQRSLQSLRPEALDRQPVICLYSGGLDSAAGLGIRLAALQDRLFVPVSVIHHSHERSRLRGQIWRLRQSAGGRLFPRSVEFSLPRPPGTGGSKREWSQRARSFLFTVVGAVTAALHDASSVEVYESGVGLVNLPLMAGMIGSKATRNCHPEFFRRMERLTSLVLERDFHFDLPFALATKGEMVQRMKGLGLADLAIESVSCVHQFGRKKDRRQCGVCAACLIRRLSLFVGGIDERTGTYKVDLLSPGSDGVGKPPAMLLAMLGQVVRLAAPDNESTRRRLQGHLYGTHILQLGESMSPIVNLLCRYRAEWLMLAEECARRGAAWPRWLGMTPSSPGSEAIDAVA